MKVSVVFPIYRSADTVLNSLGTILDQTHRDLEIICVDDGSPDNSVELLSDIRDPRVTIIRQDNRGLGGARNTGISHATGEWITFVDSDDWVHPEMIEKMVKCAERRPGPCVVDCFHRVIGRTGETVSERTRRCERPDLPYRTNIIAALSPNQACGRLYSRDLITSGARFPEKTLHEDLYFTGVAYAEAQTAETVEEPLYLWYSRDGSISRTATAKHIEDMIGSFEPVWEHLSSRSDFNEIEPAFYHRCALYACGLAGRIETFPDATRKLWDILHHQLRECRFFGQTLVDFVRDFHEPTADRFVRRFGDVLYVQ